MSQETPAKPGSAIPPEERRRYIRVRKEVHMTCRILAGPEEDFDLSTRNLSVAGLLISTRRPIPPGARLLLRAVMDSGRLEFSFTGRVAWSGINAVTGCYEAGVNLIGLDPPQRQNLLSLIGRSSEHVGVERRHYIRLKKRLFAEVRPAHRVFARWHPAHTQDISLGGAALALDEPISSATAIELRIHLDDAQGRPLETPGVVMECRRPSREQPGGFIAHVRFQNTPEAAHQRLAAYISKALSVHPAQYGGQKT